VSEAPTGIVRRATTHMHVVLPFLVLHVSMSPLRQLAFILSESFAFAGSHSQEPRCASQLNEFGAAIADIGTIKRSTAQRVSIFMATPIRTVRARYGKCVSA
jgi:hypothetical protein